MAVTSVLPTLYEHYTAGGINSGLSVDQPYFTLNGKNITIYSGAMHYFRVPEEYWRDRLRKMRAAGLNTVETYIPWNLHEPQVNQYDFGDGHSDMKKFLDVRRYLKIAQEEDLLAIVRPGPYICAEWEFGGLPSWLLREKDIKIRTSDNKFMKHVARYFAVVLQILSVFQFIRGGPVIAFQLENEYGSTEWTRGNRSFIPDKKYLEQIRELMMKANITELLFTSDSPSGHGDVGTLRNMFQTANFANNPEKEFDALKILQKNKPSMAMEFWTGWFDHWSEGHHYRNNSEFRDVLRRILAYPASVNMYMFHGGTNWGFLNGANIPGGSNKAIYQPDTTSYDYDAPLSESGDYTEKFFIVKQLIEQYNRIKTRVPSLPQETAKVTYPRIKVSKQLKYSQLIRKLPKIFRSKNVLPMELLPLNNNSGQSYGYIIYRKQLDIPYDSVLRIKGYLHDSAMVMVNNELISPVLKSPKDLNGFGFWRLKDGTLTLKQQINVTLDIIVTNWGRNNFGQLELFKQLKGLQQEVYLNDNQLFDWKIIPMEFKRSWTTSLTNWHDFSQSNVVSLCKGQLVVDQPQDTFIDMREWNTGIVIVNGFVLGRYMHIGPQQTLYLPAPILKKGYNEIIIFEHFKPATHILFSKRPIYLTKN